MHLNAFAGRILDVWFAGLAAGVAVERWKILNNDCVAPELQPVGQPLSLPLFQDDGREARLWLSETAGGTYTLAVSEQDTTDPVAGRYLEFAVNIGEWPRETITARNIGHQTDEGYVAVPDPRRAATDILTRAWRAFGRGEGQR